MRDARARSAQAKAALREANRQRLAGAALKRELAAGRRSVGEALDDPRAECLTAFAILASPSRWGRQRARRALGRAGILNAGGLPNEFKRARDLTPRQRAALAEVARRADSAA